MGTEALRHFPLPHTTGLLNSWQRHILEGCSYFPGFLKGEEECVRRGAEGEGVPCLTVASVSCRRGYDIWFWGGSTDCTQRKRTQPHGFFGRPIINLMLCGKSLLQPTEVLFRFQTKFWGFDWCQTHSTESISSHMSVDFLIFQLFTSLTIPKYVSGFPFLPFVPSLMGDTRVTDPAGSGCIIDSKMVPSKCTVYTFCQRYVEETPNKQTNKKPTGSALDLWHRESTS